MKKFSFITVALFAFTSIASQLFAQDAASKTSGYDLKKSVRCRVSQTETGCSVTFEYDVKSPRDAASGLPTGKRQHGTVKIIKDFSVSATDNSVTEVKSPRDAASGQASGKRQPKPMIISKEADKSSPKLAETVAKGKSSSDSPPSEIAIDEPGVHKVSIQDISFTKRCGGKSTKVSCDGGECEIPLDDCPNGDCSITADWSWGVSQGGTSTTGSAGSGRCSIDFLLEIEDGVCTAMAINEKGLPGDKKPKKTTTNNPK